MSSAQSSPPSLYQSSKTHYGDIKYKLRHLVRKRSRIKQEQSKEHPTLLNQVPVCPVRAGVEIDAKYQDVNLEDRFGDVTDPNIAVSISLISLFQLVGRFLKPTKFMRYLPLMIACGLGQLLCKGYHATINGHWTGAIFGPVIILIATALITLVTPLMSAINSIEIKYKPYTPVDEDEVVPLLTMEEMIELKNKLPWYMTEANVEKVSIIDEILSKMWPKINEFIQTSLKEKIINNPDLLGTIFDATKGYISLRVKAASIGSNVPKVTGIRVLSKGLPKDVIVIDCELMFNSDINIDIEGILDMGHVNIGHTLGHIFGSVFGPDVENYFEGREIEIPLSGGLSSVDLRLRTRIVLSPIFPSPPIIGTINISLLEPPLIDWHFTGLLRPFNVTILKSLLTKLTSNLVTDPHNITINLAEFIPSTEMVLGNPSQLIIVDILNCTNLPTSQDKHSVMNLTFFKPDSFVVAEVDGEKRWTHIVYNECNPKFNRSFNFMSTNPEHSYVKLLVYDDDIDQDVLLGQVSIPVKFWNKEGSVYNGTGFVSQLYHPIGLKPLVNEKKEESSITYRVSTYKLSKNKSNLAKNSAEERISAVISIFIDSATNLNQVPLTSIRSPELRSLVRVEAGNSVEVTSVKDRTGNPIFKELIHLPVIDPRLENIKISIVDMYWVMERRSYQLVGSKRKSKFTDWARASSEGSVIGKVEINTADILNSPGMKRDITNYELSGFIENGTIKMSIEIHMCKSIANIVLNRALDPVPFPDHKMYLESSSKSVPRDDGATIDTKRTINSAATSESEDKKPIFNISNLDTTVNVPIKGKK